MTKSVCLLLVLALAFGSHASEDFGLDEILGRGLLASGSGSLDDDQVGEEELKITLSFSGSKPADDELDAFKDDIADYIAETLSVPTDNITVDVLDARRRLLAFTVEVTISDISAEFLAELQESISDLGDDFTDDLLTALGSTYGDLGDLTVEVSGALSKVVAAAAVVAATVIMF